MVRRFYEEVWNPTISPRSARSYPTFASAVSWGRSSPATRRFVAYVDAVHASLTDYRCEIVDMVVECAKVVARMRFHGVHRGPLLGFAPTGRHVEWAGSAHFTFADGKVADLWVLGDVYALMKQLSPEPA